MSDRVEHVAASGSAPGKTHRVGEAEVGLRVDQLCAQLLRDHSRTQLATWIKEGIIRLDGQTVRPSLRVTAGAELTWVVPTLEVRPELQPADLRLTILYEDDAVIVLDKPAGLVVHPGAGTAGPTLAAALLHHDLRLAGVGGESRSGIVHRLDKGTSGVMVIARTAFAHRALQRQFAARTVDKRYRAIVWGRPKESEGAIDLPIGRDSQSRVKMSTRASIGRSARSLWRVLEEVPGFALLAVKIETGRTHQVRVHLAAIGHPVVADETYGGARSTTIGDPARRQAVRALTRPALHAHRLGFAHPVSGATMRFTAPFPADLAGLWAALGGSSALPA